MLAVAIMLIIIDDQVNVPPRGQMHPEWGSEPPVAPSTRSNLNAGKVIVPITFPVLGKPRWRDDFNDDRGSFRHTGIDIKATKMSPIVAPFRGIIGFKDQSFWIYGDNGWAMLGTHLNDDHPGTHDHSASRDFMFAPNIVPGDVVEEGQFIGYVGESGDATAPHLHFEMYRPGNEAITERIRDPFPSLRVAKVLTEPIVTVLSHDERMPTSNPRVIACLRGFDEKTKTIDVILLATQPANMAMKMITTPTYRKFKFGEPFPKGWEALRSIRPHIAFEIRYDTNPNGEPYPVVTKIEILRR